MADFNEEYYTEEEKRRAKRHEHRVDIIAIIFCLIAAISIWLFAVNRGNSAPETPKGETETVASQIISRI